MTAAASPLAGAPADVDPAGLAELVELGGFVEAVRPNRSRWAMFMVAAFAGLTCLGLASTTLFPRVTDRMSDRTGGASADPVGSGVPAIATATRPGHGPAEPSAGPPTVPAVEEVVATWRLVEGDATPRIFVAGAAVPGVEAITVTVSSRGQAVASAEVHLPSDAGGRDDLVPWSAFVDLPTVATGADAVATVTVSWVGQRRTAGSLAAPLVLGDGRGRRAGP